MTRFFSGILSGDRKRLLMPVAIGATLVWLAALGAYAVGFMRRAAEAGVGDGGAPVLPTLDLLFFVFAVAGPLAMLWVVVLALQRTDRLADGLAAQSDSALALAATLANLAESVDELNQGTLRRLDGLPAKVDQTLLDTTMLIDKRVGERISKVTGLLEKQATDLDGRLRAEIGKLGDAIELERAALALLRQNLGDEVSAGLGQSREQVDARLAELATKVEGGLAETQANAERGLNEALKKVEDGLVATQTSAEQGLVDTLKKVQDGLTATQTNADRGLVDTLKKVQDGLAATQANAQQGLVDTRKQADARLADMLSRHLSGVTDGDALVRETLDTLTKDISTKLTAQTQAVEQKVAAPIQRMHAQVDATAAFVAANPPASSEKLSELLADAAAKYIAPERAALSVALKRIERLEARAEELLTQIDRTSRLNPLMSPATPTGPEQAAPDTTGVELPFATLPRAAERADLNWTAVVRYLEGTPPSRTNRQALAHVAADPDVTRVARLGEEVATALAQERVFIKDVALDAVAAPAWVAFAEGQRSDATAALSSALQDDVAAALVRSRLRNDPEFHALALRLIAAYGDLLGRAATALGADPLLVEMGDAPQGRAVLVLGSVLRVFDPATAAE